MCNQYMLCLRSFDFLQAFWCHGRFAFDQLFVRRTLHPHFVVNIRVGGDIFHFISLLNALTVLVALYLTISVMRWLMVGMSFSYCSVLNRFLNSS